MISVLTGSHVSIRYRRFRLVLIRRKPPGHLTEPMLKLCQTITLGIFVGCSQKGYHFGRPGGTALPESILVGPNALHLMLRAFGSTRMCQACDTCGAFAIAKLVPTAVATD